MTMTPHELDVLHRRPLQPCALPSPRGPLTEFLFDWLVRPVDAMPAWPAPVTDLLADEDAVLALYVCYELHYRGFAAVDEGWEWEPSLLGLRRQLEDRFLEQLRDIAGPVVSGGDIVDRLVQLLASGGGPSLSTFMASEANHDQLLEFHVHRSAYQLKEADAHTWALPRLGGAAKAALVEIQADEYGQGIQKNMHSELFGLCMRELGLDDTYGAYLDVIPAATLATVNCATFFGLHRRWRGALIGHLAVFEMTSVEPMGRYSVALRRHGYGPWARLFYDTHVVADAHHQTLAARDLAGGLLKSEPHLFGDVLFGAQALSAIEGCFTEYLLECWTAGRSSLLAPVLVG